MAEQETGAEPVDGVELADGNGFGDGYEVAAGADALEPDSDGRSGFHAGSHASSTDQRATDDYRRGWDSDGDEWLYGSDETAPYVAPITVDAATFDAATLPDSQPLDPLDELADGVELADSDGLDLG